MVYIDSEELKWLPYVKTWLSGWTEELRDDDRSYLLNLFQTYVEDGIKFIHKKCVETMAQVRPRSVVTGTLVLTRGSSTLAWAHTSHLDT